MLESLGKFGFAEGCIVHTRRELSSSHRIYTNGDGALCKHNFCRVIIRVETDMGYCLVGLKGSCTVELASQSDSKWFNCAYRYAVDA